MKIFYLLSLSLILSNLLSSCSTQHVSTSTDSTNHSAVTSQQQTTPAKKSVSQTTLPLSPYSMDGLIALNQFRTHNKDLNDFLIRNRKPDFFFSASDGDFAFKKIYLIYLQSNNLYLFDPELSSPYKKFNPLPASIKQSLRPVLAHRSIISAPQEKSYPSKLSTKRSSRKNPKHTANYRYDIEKTLVEKHPTPPLTPFLLKNIPLNAPSSVYSGTYYLDRPLSDLVENSYSLKYEKSKGHLKIIFPQSYEANLLYKNTKIDTRKIFVSHNAKSGKSSSEQEMALIVPDFLAGSAFYNNVHGNMHKAFSALYQLKIPKNVSNPNRLRVRFEIKPCQKDPIRTCRVQKNGATYVRAIVIAATLYDPSSLMPLETFVIK